MSRLSGLDLARFFAFVGMVIVNFKVVMGADTKNEGLLGIFAGTLEGRAAATFVVLAGIGLGLSALRADFSQTAVTTVKRALFLLVVGLLNSLIFEADIIHYYAFYFLLGMFCLPLSTRSLVVLIGLINLAFLVMVFTLNYDAGWNWEDLSYEGFWTPIGFVRNLFFNGWHPVIPWISFLLYGIVLSRLDLANKQTQTRMILWGIVVAIAVQITSTLLIGLVIETDPELATLFGTAPVPPALLYILGGLSTATVVIGLCLFGAKSLERIGLLTLVTPAGRQALTLYIAHIVVGMGTLQALNMIGNQGLSVAVGAALIFCSLATLYALLWGKYFKRGPIEAFMRKLAG